MFVKISYFFEKIICLTFYKLVQLQTFFKFIASSFVLGFVVLKNDYQERER